MAIALALVAAALFGSGDFLGGLATRDTRLLSVLLISQGVGLIGMLLVATIVGGIVAGSDIALGALAGIAGAVGLGMLYRGLATGSMSTVAPITAVVAVAVPVVTGIGAGDRIAVPQYVGIALGVLAVALLSVGGTRALRPRRDTFLLAVCAGLALGVFYIAIAKTSPAANLWPVVSARGASVIGLVFVAAIARQAPHIGATRRIVVLGAGVCDVSATALLLLAVHRGLLSVVAVLTSLYPVFTVLWSMLVLGERLRMQQTVGIGIAIAAVALISVG